MNSLLFSFLFLFIWIPFSSAQASQFCNIGCRDGTREALNRTNVAACRGVFVGYVFGSNAQQLCAESWHVCSQSNPRDRALLKNFTFEEASNFSGCYALDAAHDFDTCRPCTGNVHEDDMAGMGRNCTRVLSDASGCYSSGRVDNCCYGYLTSAGCQFYPNITTGVICCANNPTDPCFNGTCPNNCCGNGVCDRSVGICTCNAGFSGADCCTKCSSISDCNECLSKPTCGWCNGTQTCTDRLFPSCFDLSLDVGGCPVNISQNVTTTTDINNTPVIAGGVVGGVVALLIGAGLAALILYKRFTKGEYAEFWNTQKLDKAVSNPLYESNFKYGDNPLYEEAKRKY